jgi:hypothetical protein
MSVINPGAVDNTNVISDGALPIVSKIRGHQGTKNLGVRLGKGRPPGKPNQVTRDMRRAAYYLVEERLDRFKDWIDRVAEDDPGRACDIFIRLIQTYTPKPTQNIELEIGQQTNGVTGQSVVAMRLRSLLEAPVNE